MARLIFDIETNGLNPSKVWVIVTKDIDSGTVETYVEGEWPAFNLAIKNAEEVIGHNIMGYDIPVCERLLKTDFSNCQITDTLVMSRLANPQRDAHSLAYWGEQLGYPKGDYNDWSQYTPEMVEYCKQDVNVNEQVYKRLLIELDSFGSESIVLEHEVQRIIQKQIRNGWLLDVPKARDLVAQLKEKSYDLEEIVQQVFLPLPTYIKEIVPKLKKDGTTSIVGLKFLGERWGEVSGPFSRIDWPVFNLGSRQQIGRYLKHFGWKPKDFTETGHAIVSEDILKNVKGIPEASLIASYLLVGKRIAQVRSWLESIDETTERVHGYVNTNGAVTGRMTHSKPNLAQVPSSNSLYGPECRACWIVAKRNKLVGIDASGLELRMLAHYMNDKSYVEQILDGDIHSYNQKMAGLDTRDQAKTFVYALIYGGGVAKIGQIANGSARKGKQLIDQFMKNLPAYANLKKRVLTAMRKNGTLQGLDGRRLRVESEHSALNFLLQSAGAVIMKKALVILHSKLIENRIWFKLVANVHDEWQIETTKEYAEMVGQLGTQAIKEAGESFNMNCPLDGDYKVGTTWAETH